ncbi:MAG: hypothetical protein DHS20C05_13650 [Hyphococcus sp.]|nr:MAG: hypothetical protein DHS20C05_13650 [Marinicaulis sp.]
MQTRDLLELCGERSQTSDATLMLHRIWDDGGRRFLIKLVRVVVDLVTFFAYICQASGEDFSSPSALVKASGGF